MSTVRAETRFGRLQPVFVILIILATSVGVAGALLFDARMDDGAFRFLPAAVLAIVSIVQLVLMSFVVVPSYTGANLGEGASFEQVATALEVQVASYTSAIATYGAVCGFLTDAWWIPLAFGAFALLALAFAYGRAGERLEHLRMERLTGVTG